MRAHNFLANTAAAPTEFIGLGVSAGPSYVVAENVRRCFAAEETPAAVLNAGYGYPFGILGSLKGGNSAGMDGDRNRPAVSLVYA